MSTKAVIIYCDGSSIGNPGPGGWGGVIIDGARVHECGAFEKETTNNRMEIKAAIESLKYSSNQNKNPTSENVLYTVHTDSQYLIKGITSWVFSWQKNGWKTSAKESVLNQDLWEEILNVTSNLSISWKHVRGHTGVVLNERVDEIANGFARDNPPTLFSGSAKDYPPLQRKEESNTESTPKTSQNGKVYSYISLVDNVAMRHATWAECKARVAGKRFTKFRKTVSAEDEKNILADWGKSVNSLL